MFWSKDRPTEQGWYFWRRRKTLNDPLQWSAIYLLHDNEFTDDPLEPWEGGTVVYWPTGGWWAGPIPAPTGDSDG